MSDLQRDIERIDELLATRDLWGNLVFVEQSRAWQRIRARLTPDRERVFAAITETLIRFGHDDAVMLQDCIFAAEAAIRAMGEP